MSTPSTPATGPSRALRWAVPAAVAATLAGAVVVAGTTTAGADPVDLAPRTAQELLADLAGSTATALTGTVTQTSALGLPELPAAAGAGTLGPLTLLSGTHTLRVAADGPDRSRVALVGELAEYDVVRAGRDVWTFSSETSAATHVTLPERSAAPTGDATAPAGLPATPAEAAAAALAAVGPSTEVGVDDAVVVADRPARQLVLLPRDATSLVGSVRIAVDAETAAPLRVQVTARGTTTPAVDVGFTDVSFTAPDPATFAFTPPAGAAVTELAPPAAGNRSAGAGAPGASVVGSGWGSVLVVPTGGSAPEGEQAALLEQLTTPVPGGRALDTALVSVLLTDDGRLLAGAVTPEALRAAAGS